jgi:hypothetical protein
MAHKSYTSKKRDPFTFDIDGEMFRPAGGLQLLELGELANVSELKADSAEGIKAINVFFQNLLGEAEYTRFRGYVAEHHTDPDVLLEILGDMFEGLVGHPTQRPSDSSDGPSSTGHTLRVISRSDGAPDGKIIEMPLTPEREAELLAETTSQIA